MSDPCIPGSDHAEPESTATAVPQSQETKP